MIADDERQPLKDNSETSGHSNGSSVRHILLTGLVMFAAFLDSTLTTVIVPILPDYFYRLWYPDLAAGYDPNNQTNVIQRDKVLNDENTPIGLLFASKTFCELFFFPVAGLLVIKCGASLPLLVGLLGTAASTFTFAVSSAYTAMLLARSIQGLTCGCIWTAGMSLISTTVSADKTRSLAIGFVQFAGGLGLIIGPSVGGWLYTAYGKMVTFLLITGVTALPIVVHVYLTRPGCGDGRSDRREQRQPDDERSVWDRCKSVYSDVHILGCIGIGVFGYLGISTLEPTLPLYMMRTFGSTPAQQGVVFVPQAVTYVLCAPLFTRLTTAVGRWHSISVGLVFKSVALALVSSDRRQLRLGEKFCRRRVTVCPNQLWLILPMVLDGLGHALIQTSVMPELASRVDRGHSASCHGITFASIGSAFAFAFCLGPALGGWLVGAAGFVCVLIALAVLTALYIPVTIWLTVHQ